MEETNLFLINEIKEIRERVENFEGLITERFDRLERMIENKIVNLEETKLNNVQESLQRMNRHIDFINETYSTLQTPLTYFKHKVEYLMGYDYTIETSSSLPSIKDKEYD